MNTTEGRNILPSALFVPVGPVACGNAAVAAKLIAGGLDPQSIVSLRAIGPVQMEIQAGTRLRAGLPVLINAPAGTDLSRLLSQAVSVGMPTVALVASADIAFVETAGFDMVVTYDTVSRLEVMGSGPDLRHISGPFAVIGDIHGCWETLQNLLAELGFDEDLNHPDGLIPVLAGDTNDKGGKLLSEVADPADVGSVRVLRWALRHWLAGRLIWVKGNHERKLGRKLAKVVTGELDELSADIHPTIEALLAQVDADELVADLVRFLPRLPTHVQLDDDGHQVIVAHGGMRADLVGTSGKKAENFCLYVREKWADRWTRPETVIFGHVVQESVLVRRADADPEASNLLPGETVGIDTGAYRGGGLTAYLTRTREVQQVPSHPDDVRSDTDLATLDFELGLIPV